MNYKRFQLNLIHLNAIDSTNNYAANLLKETNLVNGTTILTKRQEFGRGQRGNSWQTEPDKNLILSTVIFPKIKSQYVFYLNIMVSLAVEKTLCDLGIVAKVKWPNDIYVGERKICGILVENQIQGNTVNSAILGIGFNINQIKFSEGINATSVALEKGEEFDLEDIFMQLYGYLDFYCDHLMNSNFPLLLKRYYEVLFQKGVKATYQDQNGTFEGTITGIDHNGRLQIKVVKETRVYDLQEVKYLF